MTLFILENEAFIAYTKMKRSSSEKLMPYDTGEILFHLKYIAE